MGGLIKPRPRNRRKAALAFRHSSSLSCVDPQRRSWKEERKRARRRALEKCCRTGDELRHRTQGATLPVFPRKNF
jgi:hypothetical protein